MTYLQIVNQVLALLREDTISSVTETSYSSLIGQFVNIIKEEVEDSWDWTVLREIITVSALTGTSEYDLTGTNYRTRVVSAFNDTQDYDLYKKDNWYAERMNLLDTDQNDPMYFVHTGQNSSGELKIKLYPTPDEDQTIKFFTINPQDTLSSDSTTISVPFRPVILGSYAMAIEEKGETGSINANSAYSKYHQALANAIILDTDKQSNELIATVE